MVLVAFSLVNSACLIFSKHKRVKALYCHAMAGCHTIFYHRYHIVWVPKYQIERVLGGKIRERIRTIVRQVCKEMGVTIVSGVLSTDHVHIFVEIPPHITISRFMQRARRLVFVSHPNLRPGYSPVQNVPVNVQQLFKPYSALSNSTALTQSA